MTTADKIASVRKSLNLTYGRIGRLCGYSGEYIKRVESGKSTPKPLFLDSFARNLHVNPDWLKGNDEAAMFLSDFDAASPGNGESGLRIKASRIEKGLSQVELASMINGTTKTVSDIENGKKEVTPRMAKRIEIATGIGADWILYGEGRNKDYPVGDEMVEYLKNHPEDRKVIWSKMHE